MSDARVSDPGASSVPSGAMGEPSIPELVSSLRFSFRKADFDRVERILVARDGARSSLSEALTLKEIEKVELETKREALRKEMEGLRSRNAQLEERARKAEDGFRVLSVEQETKQREAKGMCALLEAKVGGLVSEKSAADRETEKFRILCRKLEEQVHRVEEEQRVLSLRERMAQDRIEEMKKREQDSKEKTLELQVENKSLEGARRRAEAEAMDWKKKYGELEAIILRLYEENLKLKAKGQEMPQKIGCENGSNVPDKPNIDEACEEIKSRQFLMAEVVDSDKKVEGAARSGVRSVPMSVIEIFDSDDEMEQKDCNHVKQNPAGTLGANGDSGTKKFSNKLCLDLENGGAVLAGSVSSRENVISTSTPKRKRTSRVIMSDSESAEDESKSSKEELTRKKIKETEEPLSCSRNCSPVSSSGDGGKEELITPSRRRLVPLSQRREVKHTGKQVSPRDSATPILPTTNRDSAVAGSRGNVCRKLQYPGVEFDEGHEIRGGEESMESDSEGESLGGFIVHDESDASDNEFSMSDTSGQEASSDSSIDHVFAKIHRVKSSVKWEYEADMLASFGKDPVICMKAVCALYRQQTADEQSVKEALLTNNRGFSKFDAKRGSRIADFLMGGNPKGPLTKSVKDLQKHDPGAVEYCHKLATHYSKQLFMIYQSKEDPYFLPT